MDALTDRMIESMKERFGDDRKRIDHALSVLEYARKILSEEDGDPTVVIAAAILHDIGIREAERIHGSSAGKYQEIEGPPIARAVMEQIGLEDSVIEHVCRIVGSHHSARDIDTPEFRIIWNADWLVNLPDENALGDRDKVRTLIERIFRTKTGKIIAYRLYVDGDSGGA